MAKPRETPARDPPPVESEEEESEEEISEEENEGSESESEPEGPAKAKKSSVTPAPATKKPDTAAHSSSSSEDEESGSETDTDSPLPKKVDSTIKPIASKPMSEPEREQSEKVTAAKKSNRGPTSPTRAASAGAKRPAQVPAATPAGDADAKRSKREVVENSEKKATPSKLFARIWSEEDEIAVLKGMIEYKLKKKADPVAHLDDFHDFIRDKINTVTRTQLQDKMRRLRKKYFNNAAKEKNGKERTFSNPHEQQTYELSKKIWGKKNVGEETPEPTEAPKANGTAVRKSRSRGSVVTAKIEKIEEAEEEANEGKSLANKKNKSISYVSDGRAIDEWVFNDGTELLEEKERADLEKQWKKLRTEEAGVLVKRLEISHAHAKKVYDALKSSE